MFFICRRVSGDEEEGTDEADRIHACSKTADGNAVFAGYTDGDWEAAGSGFSAVAAVKLNVSDGEVLWRYQAGVTGGEVQVWAIAARADGSTVLAGYTEGDWDGELVGMRDFMAVAIDADGEELWRWQDGESGGHNTVFGIAALSDDSTVLVGYTRGDYAGVNAGEDDFVAVKLNAAGEWEWSWQDGTAYDDAFEGVATGIDGDSVIIGGSTYGNWAEINEEEGNKDFVGISLDSDGTTLWTYQSGTTLDNEINNVAVRPDGAALLAGSTEDEFSDTAATSLFSDFAGVLIGTASEIISPTATTPSPMAAPSSAPATPAPTKSPSSTPVSSSPATEVSPAPSTPGPTVAKSSIPDSPVPTASPQQLGSTAPVGTSPSSLPLELAIGGSLGGFTALLLAGIFLARYRAKRKGITDHPTFPVASSGVPSGGIYDAASPSPPPPYSETSPHWMVHDSDVSVHQSMPPAPEAGTNLDGLTPPPVDGNNGGTEVRNVPDDVRHDAQAGRSEFPSGKNRNRAPSGMIGVAEAVLISAQQLAENCEIPGVSEAATMVSILVSLVTDHRDNIGRTERDVKRCRSIMVMLQRASEVLGMSGNTGEDADRILLEDVNDAVGDLVDIIKTYKSKNKISQVLMSSLFRQRQDEAEAVIDRAISRLQLGLQVRMGLKLNKFGEKLDEVGQDVKWQEHQRKHFEESIISSASESLAETRRMRRKRNLDQMEIPEDQVVVTNELLGRGGFGAVYIADYNGRNAAAKVVLMEHELSGLDLEGHDKDGKSGPTSPLEERVRSQRKAFLHELEAMVRLRSPHTVDIYGAITSRKDRLVLVMELLVGGDLRSFLKNSEGLLQETVVRRIIRDVCAGVAFLHSKGTVHGDIKSANVLLDGAGRAKIADFGTSRWVRQTNSAGFATRTTAPARANPMTFAWAAPEVLDSEDASCASDVYSFGMVAWEVLTTEVPWSDQGRGRDIYLRVVVKGDRPEIPEGTPDDIANVLRECWAETAGHRPMASEILTRMRSHG